jgi:hypothetical protein
VTPSNGVKAGQEVVGQHDTCGGCFRAAMEFSTRKLDPSKNLVIFANF